MAHGRTVLTTLVVASAALCGCVSLVPVDLKPRLRAADLPPLEAPWRGVRFDEQTTTLEISKRPMLHVARPLAERGATVSYDRLLWTFLRMPCFPARGVDGERCMALVDTGLSGEIARVTADVAIRQRLPSRRRYPEFAWVSRFDLAEGLSLREFPASIHPLRYEARLAGLPIYRHSGYVLGLLAVQAFSYVEFDNARRRATFGFRTPFAPKDPSHWDAYPMRVENHVLVADVPVAGRRVRLCPDTGGGPVPVLNPADWKEIEPHVKVRLRKRSSYPAWEGFVPAVAYTLEELEVGNQRLRNAVVHVKTGSGPDAAHASTVGLGTFKHTTVVFDFKNMKLWVKKPRAVRTGPHALSRRAEDATFSRRRKASGPFPPLPLSERAGVKGEREEVGCATSHSYSDAYPSPPPSPTRGEGVRAPSSHVRGESVGSSARRDRERMQPHPEGEGETGPGPDAPPRAQKVTSPLTARGAA